MRVLLVLLLAGCVAERGHDGPVLVDESFEDGLSAWRIDMDLPADPNDPGHDVAADAVVAERARTGGSGLRFFLDGSQDDGTVWIERHLDVAPGQRTFDASFHFWSASESFNTIAHAVAYLGPADPESEDSFPPSGESSSTSEIGFGGLREPLDRAAGWETYSFTWRTSVPEGGLWFAIGISAVWETSMDYDLDDVRLEARLA